MSRKSDNNAPPSTMAGIRSAGRPRRRGILAGKTPDRADDSIAGRRTGSFWLPLFRLTGVVTTGRGCAFCSESRPEADVSLSRAPSGVLLLVVSNSTVITLVAQDLQ